MSITQSIYARTTVSLTDLRRNPSGILEDAGDSPVAELTKIAKQRLGGKRVKVTLEDL